MNNDALDVYLMWKAYCEIVACFGYTYDDRHWAWYKAFPHIIYPCKDLPAGWIFIEEKENR